MILDTLLQLFFPKICPICEKQRIQEEKICSKCRDKIIGLPLILHQKIVEEVQMGDDSPLIVAFLFNSTLRKILHRLKYDGFDSLGVWLGMQMAYRIKSRVQISFDFIIPVPLHSRKLKERGYNQSERLAEGIGQLLSIPVLSDCLCRQSYTKSQTKLNKQQRMENVKQKFRVQRPELIRGKNILLIDDVVTTGATLNECSRQLKNEGQCFVLKCAAGTPLF